MSTPDKKTDQSPDRQIFENLVESARNASSAWEGINEFMARDSFDPDRMFSIVTRCTTISPNNLRTLVSGALNWDDWDNFKLDVISDVVRHEFKVDLQTRVPQRVIPPSPTA